MRLLCLAVMLCGGCLAQTTGVMSEWDVSTMLTSLENRAKQLAPTIEKMRPDIWKANGAPPTYGQQWTTAKNEVQYLIGSAQALSKDPERLTLALETLFRMQALDTTLDSLIEATRKYQNPALADVLQARLGETSVSRDKLRQYVVELAAQKEHEFQVMDSEAQRCRTAIAGPRSGSTQRRKGAPPASENK